jgi:hypothetical protein
VNKYVIIKDGKIELVYSNHVERLYKKYGEEHVYQLSEDWTNNGSLHRGESVSIKDFIERCQNREGTVVNTREGRTYAQIQSQAWTDLGRAWRRASPGTRISINDFPTQEAINREVANAMRDATRSAARLGIGNGPTYSN